MTVVCSDGESWCSPARTECKLAHLAHFLWPISYCCLAPCAPFILSSACPFGRFWRLCIIKYCMGDIKFLPRTLRLPLLGFRSTQNAQCA